MVAILAIATALSIFGGPARVIGARSPVVVRTSSFVGDAVALTQDELRERGWRGLLPKIYIVGGGAVTPSVLRHMGFQFVAEGDRLFMVQTRTPDGRGDSIDDSYVYDSDRRLLKYRMTTLVPLKIKNQAPPPCPQ